MKNLPLTRMDPTSLHSGFQMIYNMGDGTVFPMYKSSSATVVATSRVSSQVTVTIELSDGAGLTTNAPEAATQVRSKYNIY